MTISEQWYTRPVIAVADATDAVAFYVDRLGFTQDWKYTENDTLLVTEVQRGTDCRIILDAAVKDLGPSRLWISLVPDEMRALKSELKRASVVSEEGFLGYPVTIVRDPWNNQLVFCDE